MKSALEQLALIFRDKQGISKQNLYELFDEAGIPKENCWRTIYRLIFDTTLRLNPEIDQHLSRTRMEPVMKTAINNARDKSFTEETIMTLIKEYNAASFSLCYNELAEVLDELDNLTGEFKSMHMEKEEKIKGLQADTISVVESELSIKDKIKLIKQKFKNTIRLFHEDLNKLDQIANTDHLTGIFNRRFFDDRLINEVDQALNEKTWLNLLMIDIDNFKSFNDNYGHLIGDQALKTVAKHIRDCCREASCNSGIPFYPVRYGGEEFAVILPAIDHTFARHVAEEIRASIGNYTFVIRNKKGEIKHKGLNLTVSIGVSALNHGFELKQALDALVKDADNAMYQAKTSGKNCVRTVS